MPEITLPNESGQYAGGGGSRQERRQARRQARRERRQAKREGKYEKKPLAEKESKAWAVDVLSGSMEKNPWFQRLMSEESLDPSTNPYVQSMKADLEDQIRRDWLGEARAADERAEAAGRFGSGTWQASRTAASEAANRALASGINQLNLGSYENERNRQMQGLSQLLGAQQSAARIPIEYGQLGVQRGQLGVARGQLGVQRGQLGLARNQFDFSKKMQLAAAQQDALADYFNLLSGIGGMGGSTWGNTGGQYVPTQNPWVAGATAGLGGYLQGMQ